MDAIVGAISAPGSYLWSFKMYWVITAPVTLVTILLPLIAGHIFRSITQFCYENRTYALTLCVILLRHTVWQALTSCLRLCPTLSTSWYLESVLARLLS